MSGFMFAASCDRCGGRLEHVTGTDHKAATEQVAVARCASCNRDFLLLVQLRPLVKDTSRQRARYRRQVA